MILVHCLCAGHAAVEPRQEEGRRADCGLQEQIAVGDDAEVGVDRVPVGLGVEALVVLDDDEPGDERGDSKVVEPGMPVRPGEFLGRGVRRLDDED